VAASSLLRRARAGVDLVALIWRWLRFASGAVMFALFAVTVVQAWHA
jgi:hypothetical protein